MQTDGTIKSSLSELVIDVQGDLSNPGANAMLMQPHNGSESQTWVVDGLVIKLKNHEKAFDRPGNVKEPGVQIRACKKHGNLNQRWELVDVENKANANVDNIWQGPGREHNPNTVGKPESICDDPDAAN